MKRTQALTLSVIILAYNEERHIVGCLRSISNQTVVPDEVILVNNNSTDRTVELAKQFDFVKIVHETTQGMIPARNHGFRVAKGDILGRIDCDARLEPDWVESVKSIFEDPEIDAVSGTAKTNIFPFVPWPRSRIFAWAYHILARGHFRMPVLWGSNMALRRTAWDKISAETNASDALVHEDLDMSVLLWAKNLHVRFYPDLCIYTGGEQFLYAPKLMEYANRRRTTKVHHKNIGTLDKAIQNANISVVQTKLKTFLLLPLGLVFVLFSVATTLLVWVGRMFGVRITL